jgi:hypothetical protein
VQQNVDPVQQNVVLAQQNVVLAQQNVDPMQQNVSSHIQCGQCKKEFNTQWLLKRHIQTCKGKVLPTTCDYCKKTFTSRSGKHKHIRICKVKAEIDFKALVVVSQAHAPHVSSNEVTHIDTQHVQQQNNIQQQTNIETQTINIVIYNNVAGENVPVYSDHIKAKELAPFLVTDGSKPTTDKLTGVVREYTHRVMARPENQCVKKTNLRSSHSQVHVGNNTWECRLDKEVYPRMMNSIANDFSDYMHDHFKRRDLYKSLDAFIDYMASDGYCSSDKTKTIENSFKTLVKELKLLTFDTTKHSASASAAR